MTNARRRIPPDVEAKLLFVNDRQCCICKDGSRGVQIHHIDGNRNNNSFKNLAVVCTDHHDKIHKRGGVTKGISPSLVRRYKASWESQVAKRRQLLRGPRAGGTSHLKAQFKFEVRRVACEIAALGDSDAREIRLRLEYLHWIYLLENMPNEILEALHQISFIVGTKSLRHSTRYRSS